MAPRDGLASGFAVVAGAAELLRPPPKQTVTEWAEAERRLSPEASAKPGRFSTKKAPYQREIMDAVNDRRVETIVVMKSAQVGATEILNNIAGYYIHRDPCPVMILQPTEGMAKQWSTKRFDPMVRDTPALRSRVFTRRSKDGTSNVFEKGFRGGTLSIVGTNSPSQLASRPVRVVLMDERDRHAEDAGDEGDPGDLARKRATTFYNRKFFITSTPTIKGRSRIEQDFEGSDKRYFMVACPHCGHRQRLTWAGIQWRTDAEGRPKDVRYQCEDCGTLLEEKHKRGMLDGGEWVATRPFAGIAGFHISELYSPWSTWTRMVKAFLRAKKSGKTRLKTWVNIALGEPWEEHESRIEPHEVEERAERYLPGTPPKPVVLLTAGVDVQENRLEVLIKGWGVEEGEAWAVDLRFLEGDPRKPRVWKDLDALLLAPITRADGTELRIAACCVDSGFLADRVYRFTGPRRGRRIYSTKGVGGEGRPLLGRPTEVGEKKRRTKATLYPVGADTGKDLFYGRLATKTHGPGFQHYPQGGPFDREFFEQLTSETKETQFARGRKSTRWVKLRRRNEGLDLEVLNLAAFSILTPNLTRIARALEPEPVEAAPPEPLVDLTEETRKKRRSAARRNRGKFTLR